MKQQNQQQQTLKIKLYFYFFKAEQCQYYIFGNKTFEDKYNIKFYEQGCIGSNCAKEYNEIIFDYLFKKYGKKWTKQIRKDVIGFKNWKKQP